MIMKKNCILIALALQAAARLADRVGDPQADDYRALAAKIRVSLNNLAWDETRGLYRADPTDAAVFGRQANIFVVVFGVADDRQSVRIGELENVWLGAFCKSFERIENAEVRKRNVRLGDLKPKSWVQSVD